MLLLAFSHLGHNLFFPPFFPRQDFFCGLKFEPFGTIHKFCTTYGLCTILVRVNNVRLFAGQDKHVYYLCLAGSTLQKAHEFVD